MEKHPASQYSREQLASLFQIGQGAAAHAEGVDKDELAGEILRERLAGALPLDSAVVESLPLVIRRLCRDLAPLDGKPMGEALLDKDTPLEVVRRVKEHGRRLANQSEQAGGHGSLLRPAAITLYYAAIASALVHHGEKITSHRPADMAGSLRDLCDKSWMAPELRGLLRRAAEICDEEAPHADT